MQVQRGAPCGDVRNPDDCNGHLLWNNVVGIVGTHTHWGSNGTPKELNDFEEKGRENGK